MRPRTRLGFITLATTTVAVVVACSVDEGGGTELETPIDSGPPSVRADARTTGSDAEAPASTMRLAHLGAESGPIDFCYQEARAGTFVGPVLGGPRLARPDAGTVDPSAGDAAHDAGDGSTDDASLDASAETDAGTDAEADADADAAAPMLASLAFGSVTKYLVLQSSGPMTIAIVEGGATSCASPIATGDVTLDPGKLFTVAVFSRPGDGGLPGLEVTSFTDDRTTASDTIRVRTVHAALGTSFAQAEGPLAARVSAGRTTVIADRVEPRRVATESETVQVDALGYVTAAPVPPPATIAVGPAETDGGADAGFESWISAPYDLGLSGGSLHTAFIVHASKSTVSAGAPAADAEAARKGAFRVLWCADTITEGDRTNCDWIR